MDKKPNLYYSLYLSWPHILPALHLFETYSFSYYTFKIDLPIGLFIVSIDHISLTLARFRLLHMFWLSVALLLLSRSFIGHYYFMGCSVRIPPLFEQVLFYTPVHSSHMKKNFIHHFTILAHVATVQTTEAFCILLKKKKTAGICQKGRCAF